MSITVCVDATFWTANKEHLNTDPQVFVENLHSGAYDDDDLSFSNDLLFLDVDRLCLLDGGKNWKYSFRRFQRNLLFYVANGKLPPGLGDKRRSLRIQRLVGEDGILPASYEAPKIRTTVEEGLNLISNAGALRKAEARFPHWEPEMDDSWNEEE